MLKKFLKLMYNQRVATRALPDPSLHTPHTARLPFHPNQSPTTQLWAPPMYSLRRQADLVNRAYALGKLHRLPNGPKKDKLETRLASSDPSSSLPASFFTPITTPDHKWDPDRIRRHQRSIISALVKDKGPYVGRAQGVPRRRILQGIFKGRKTYRQRPQKERDIAENMADMDQRVAEWRSEKVSARAKARPSQPF